MTDRGLFVGLITLDLLYQVTDIPQCNQKIVALDYTLAAGGPAANAAVTFAHLGHPAIVLGGLGRHPLSQLVQADLQTWGVAIADLCPDLTEPLPTSSILVSQSTGERAVVSLNAVNLQRTVADIPAAILQAIDRREMAIVLIDGHQMAVGESIAQRAKAHQIPIVIDGGSWKPGFETVLRWADYAICSSNFYPPGCQSTSAVIEYLVALQIPQIAITRSEQSIVVWQQGTICEIPVPSIQAVDTLGAGDVFHGAFCHFIQSSDFCTALQQAAIVAARSCESFGTRQWMEGEHTR